MVSAQGQLYKIDDSAIRAPENLGGVHVLFDEDTFYLAQDDEIKEVQAAFVDPVLRTVKNKNVLDKYFQSDCKIAVKQMQDGEFKLTSTVPGKGGGPVLCAVFYWGTKVACYGGLIAGATVATTATAGVAGPALAMAGGVAAGSIAAGAAGATAAAAAGTLATGIGAAGAATVAAGAGTAAIAGAGGVAGVATGIESAAMFMGWVGAIIPWF